MPWQPTLLKLRAKTNSSDRVMHLRNDAVQR